MKEIHPSQCKTIVLLLTNNFPLAEKVIKQLEKKLGPLELQSPWFHFDHTNYYEDELGVGLKRCLLGFKKICEPHRLRELKKFTKRLEKKFGRRPLTPPSSTRGEDLRGINIDPGYVDLFKVVLASGKSGGQKVALSKDVYAHPLLRFGHNQWDPFVWTFPDFQSKQYHKYFLNLRQSLRMDPRLRGDDN